VSAGEFPVYTRWCMEPVAWLWTCF